MNKTLLFFLLLCSLCLHIACGCSGSSTPPPVIGVALTPNPAQALDASQSASFTATVTNDASNQGVSWTVVCPAGGSACGAMAQAKSASGAANQYVAPANVSAAQMVTVTATSLSDGTKSASVQLTVNPALALVNPPPAQPQTGLVGGSFSYNLANFVQGGTAPFTWTIKSGTLPAGLALDAKTGMITGTPTAATTGAVVIVFTCTDSGTPAVTLSANLQISLTINQPAPLTITSGNPPDGTINVKYGPSTIVAERCVWSVNGSGWHLSCTPCPPASCGGLHLCTNNHALSPCFKIGLIYPGFALTATGGVPGYKWTLAAGSSLPPGLSITANNRIAGTPTQFGTFNFGVSVTDSASPAAASQTSPIYKITIAPPPLPVINAVSQLPIGTLNSPYVGFTFTATSSAPPLAWSETGALSSGMNFSPVGLLSGQPTTAGSFPITVQVQDAFGQNSAPQNFTIQVLTQGFAPTSGSLTDPRVLHVAVLLPTGKVLVMGGTNTTGISVTAELYDPAAGTFAPTKGSMGLQRISATATVLQSGKVLITGGKGPDGTPVATAEIYDPAADAFVPTAGNMQTARVYHTATLLNDGTVLVTGGLDVNGNSSGIPVATAELFDPNTTTFTPVASMGTARNFHTATLLASGKALVTGGFDGGSGLATAELYDPVTKVFSPTTGNMNFARAGHTATLVSGGQVLLAGGAANFGGAATTTAELFDPATGTFSSTTGAMINARSLHTATLLNNGQVLLAGGDSFFYNGGQGTSLSAAELFDPATGSFISTADMSFVRESHTATLLNTGQVLVVGGSNGTLGYSATTTVLATAELYK